VDPSSLEGGWLQAVVVCTQLLLIPQAETVLAECMKELVTQMPKVSIIHYSQKVKGLTI
jgi:hypothetical protein